MLELVRQLRLDNLGRIAAIDEHFIFRVEALLRIVGQLQLQFANRSVESGLARNSEHLFFDPVHLGQADLVNFFRTGVRSCEPPDEDRVVFLSILQA